MASTQEVGDIFGAGNGPAQSMLRAPTVLIVSVGLWGMNLFFFRLFGIDYKYVLNYDLREMEGNSSNNNNNNNDSHESTSSSASAMGNGGGGGAAVSAAAKNKSATARGGGDDTCTVESSSDHEDGKTVLMGNSGGSPTSDTSAGTTVTASTLSSVVSASFLDASQQDNYGASITWFKLVVFSVLLLFLLHFTTHFWMDHLGRGSIGAVFSFYAAVMAYIFLPLQSNRWLRRAFVAVLQRNFELINPRCYCLFLPPHSIPRKIPFVDVFYADAMCSLSKVFFDWGMLLHQASHYPDPVPMAAHNILLPSCLAALPFVIRARQCLIMYTVGRLQGDPKRYQHLMNALKYGTSILPLCVSAYQKTLSDPKQAEGLEKYLIVLLIINALYGLYWDIVMDWGMMQNPSAVVQTACFASGSGSKTNRRQGGYQNCHHVCLRPRLRFGLILSTLILVADALLRFSWTLRFVARFPTNDAYVLCTQFLEVFRRAIWNLLRVEWENIKQKNNATQVVKLKARDSLSDHDPQENFDEEDNDLELSSLLLGGSNGGKDSIGTSSAPSSLNSVVIVGLPVSLGNDSKKQHGRKISGGGGGGRGDGGGGGGGGPLKK